MGAGQSSSVEIGGSTMGYQVLRVYPDSPGGRAGLRAYFDFIIAIGNTRFNKENGSLREILKASVGQKLSMIVYNTRTKTVRNVEIVPSTSWGGNGLLGVSIKHSSYDRADERVWHVVEVEPGSPAQQAGFKASEDYVIGSDSILQENDDLYNLIEAHEGKALKLFVYNVKTDNCREVICYPNSRWGGSGYLGCEFGHGLLHRVPVANTEDQRATDVAMQQKKTLPTSNNPYSFQGQFTQLHSNNNTTVNNDLINTSNNINNFQRPTMNMQPGEQMLHKALFDLPQQYPQSTESPKTPNQHPSDEQGQQFQQAVTSTSNLPSPPMQQTSQQLMQHPMHQPRQHSVQSSMQQTPQQLMQPMQNPVQSPAQQTSQQPMQQPMYQLMQQHPVQPPMQPPIQPTVQAPIQPPQTFAQLAAVHQTKSPL